MQYIIMYIWFVLILKLGVTPFERHVVNALAEIKQRLDIQAKNTKQISDYLCKSVENIYVDQAEFGFPHDTMEAFEELENSLEDKKKKKQLVFIASYMHTNLFLIYVV